MKDDDKIKADELTCAEAADLSLPCPTAPLVVLRASRVPASFLPIPTPLQASPTSLDQSLPNENQSIPPGALPDDPDPRCGFGLFSLPLEDPLTPACSAHDAANMLHHQGDNSMSRDEADKRLQNGLLLLAEHETGYRVLGSGFDKAYEILRAKILGKIGTFFNRWFWWEPPK